jgi:hypothetical protein
MHIAKETISDSSLSKRQKREKNASVFRTENERACVFD